MARKRQNGKANVSYADIKNAQPHSPDLLRPTLWNPIAARLRPKMAASSAYFALLAAAVAADGLTAPEESQELAALTNRTRTLSKLRPDALEQIKRAIKPRLERSRLPHLVEHATVSLPKKMRVSVFGHACDIIFADRVVLLSERNFLKGLIDRLDLPDTEAENMLRAIRAKNLY